jgi:D-alanine-D-alanine ligase
MCPRIGVVYNEPEASRYDHAHEEKAVFGVLEAVEAVRQSLLETEWDVVLLPLTPPFDSARKKLASLKTDLVFNLFEGFCGEPETEALVPEVLEELGLLYTGCPGPVLRLALDKAKVKVLLQTAGIATPDFQLLYPETLSTFRLAFPCIVKPCAEDASHGITADSVVADHTSLRRQVKLIATSYGSGALVEHFVAGREFNATVIGSSTFAVLPVSEIVYSLPSEIPPILSFAAKWEPESAYYQGTTVTCPAEIGQPEREHIADTALAAFRLIGCRGYARVDMRRDEQGRLNVIEVNPNPDISPDAGAARQAHTAGMNYTQFIDMIVKMALENKSNDSPNPPDGCRGQASIDANTPGYSRI